MEIEVGEYVRTKRGYIRKVIRRDMDKHILLDIGFEGANYLTKVEEKEDIVKHSKNIINLVEVGDYVNGEEVIEVREQEGKIYLMTGYVPQTYIKEDIKSIVTHEQFESIEYKVEE